MNPDQLWGAFRAAPVEGALVLVATILLVLALLDNPRMGPYARTGLLAVVLLVAYRVWKAAVGLP